MADRLPAPELPDWLERLVPFERYAINVDEGVDVHVMEQGEGRPVIAFHGNPTWGFLYRKVAAELVGDPCRVIMPDLVGLGFSSRVPRERYTLENHAAWMARLVQRLDLKDAIAVVQDWGGPIGLGAFINQPDRLGGLVVLNTVIGPPRPGFKPTAFHRIFATGAGEFLSRRLGLPQKRLGIAQGDRKSISGEVQKAYSYALRGKKDYQAVVDFVRMVPSSLEHPSIPAMREIGDLVDHFTGPSAIVWGDKDPVLGRVRRRVSRQLPDATVIATDGGHFLQEEVPGEIASAVRAVGGWVTVSGG